MWQWVARGNIQQISYIPQTEQHSPFGLMLLHLGNVTIMYVYVCMYVCMYVWIYVASFPGLLFVLQFVFSIIHGNGRVVKNGEVLGTLIA